jgi:hypothetical protein
MDLEVNQEMEMEINQSKMKMKMKTILTLPSQASHLLNHTPNASFYYCILPILSKLHD